MSRHSFVAIQYTPIEFEIRPDETIDIFTSEVQDEASRQEAVIGCYFCSTPLNINTYDEDCAGASVEQFTNDGGDSAKNN